MASNNNGARNSSEHRQNEFNLAYGNEFDILSSGDLRGAHESSWNATDPGYHFATEVFAGQQPAYQDWGSNDSSNQGFHYGVQPHKTTSQSYFPTSQGPQNPASYGEPLYGASHSFDASTNLLGQDLSLTPSLYPPTSSSSSFGGTISPQALQDSMTQAQPNSNSESRHDTSVPTKAPSPPPQNARSPSSLVPSKSNGSNQSLFIRSRDPNADTISKAPFVDVSTTSIDLDITKGKT
jgi:hypothetical protein